MTYSLRMYIGYFKGQFRNTMKSGDACIHRRKLTSCFAKSFTFSIQKYIKYAYCLDTVLNGSHCIWGCMWEQCLLSERIFTRLEWAVGPHVMTTLVDMSAPYCHVPNASAPSRYAAFTYTSLNIFKLRNVVRSICLQEASSLSGGRQVHTLSSSYHHIHRLPSWRG